MDREQVLASEKATVVSESIALGLRQIVCKIFVNGFTGSVTYMLENDKLISASVSFRNDRTMEMFNQMSKDLSNKHGKPAFQTGKLIVWRLPATEIALAHLPNNMCYVAYWEKGYFAQMNRMSWAGQQ